MMKPVDSINQIVHDPRDPNPWQALFLDQSIPFNEEAKAAFLQDAQSKSRQYLYPIARTFARLSIILITLLKMILPNKISSPNMLHKVLYWGMKTWVSPNANLLILRHFNIGSEILEFVRNNTPEIELEMNPLKPQKLEAVKDNLFLDHDLNLYNFIIKINKELMAKQTKIEPQAEIDYSCITTGSFKIEEMPNRWTNFLDLTTAIELFTPIYQLFLTDNDFWRAANSLQLDETIGLYAATILNSPQHLSLLNNKHPMVPLSTMSAGFRLVLHGLAAEQLHNLLVKSKNIGQSISKSMSQT